ncbi:Rpn family recombination-promoting nuclease/putative transposase, partial [Haloimpatiens lingqiaonensis]|uniref:Rpn family recombination-promoting nuclease/putative transposase n=1 Tax=Haloimpatiens lingqiaonensis TaxID=1380675 RepID=UPI001485B977
MKHKKIHHEHDVGYKYIFSHKETFLELLRSFTKNEWVNLIKEDDLVLVDKSYILSDFEEEESDILYKVNINGQEVLFYVLLEFQSKVDFQMPIRLLFYMTEIWRDILKNVHKNERRRKSFKLPAIIPIVIYNGKNNWTAVRSFKEVLSGYELFGENIIDFSYILLDINKYSKEELCEISNLVSSVFFIDQNMDEKELVKRLRTIIYVLKKITPEQYDIFRNWLKGIIKPRLPRELQDELENIMETSNQWEVESMVYSIQKVIDGVEKKGIKKGIEQGIERGME